MVDPCSIDPQKWADAGVSFIQRGGWAAFALAAWFIFMKWGSWIRGARKEG